MLKKQQKMLELKKALVIQTAFLGDVVLTLPLIQELKRSYPQSEIDALVIPECGNALHNHPDVHETLVFDKRGNDSGITGIWNIAGTLRRKRYDIALIPHRSLRSAALARIAGIQRNIGFNTSAGRWLFSDVVEYKKDVHEIDRNLQLLKPLEITCERKILPRLYPSREDVAHIDEFLTRHHLTNGKIISIAPGTVWNTKRWLPERFAELAMGIIAQGMSVTLVGGKNDAGLSEWICSSVSSERIVSAAGKLSVLQSAELIKRSAVLVTNDSAPMHLAGAMQTRVVAIFGATIPGFGFAPIGHDDVVLETRGLHCRPCSIHGGKECPVKTFDCMKQITPEQVLTETLRLAALP